MSEVQTWSVTAASNNSAVPDGWPENMNRSGVNNSARENMAAIKRWQADTNGSLTSGGGTTAYTLAANRTTTAAYQGEMFTFKVNATNTGAVTLNVTPSGGSARGVVAVQKAGSALVAGDWVIGDIVTVTYDGTQYQMRAGVKTLATLSDIAAQTVSQVPNADNAIDLGSSSKSWRNSYLNTGLYVSNQKFQSFVLLIKNNGGTIQHAIYENNNGGTTPGLSSQVSNASVTDTTTPTATDSSTAFSAGGKISSASTNTFILDTAAQVLATCAAFCFLVSESQSPTTPLLLALNFTSRNVNGTTRLRPEIQFLDTTGAAFALTTANIAAGKQIRIQVFGFLT